MGGTQGAPKALHGSVDVLPAGGGVSRKGHPWHLQGPPVPEGGCDSRWSLLPSSYSVYMRPMVW